MTQLSVEKLYPCVMQVFLRHDAAILSFVSVERAVFGYQIQTAARSSSIGGSFDLIID